MVVRDCGWRLVDGGWWMDGRWWLMVLSLLRYHGRAPTRLRAVAISHSARARRVQRDSDVHVSTRGRSMHVCISFGLSDAIIRFACQHHDQAVINFVFAITLILVNVNICAAAEGRRYKREARPVCGLVLRCWCISRLLFFPLLLSSFYFLFFIRVSSPRREYYIIVARPLERFFFYLAACQGGLSSVHN